MESGEIRRWFYVLISDRRGEMRDEARGRISAEGGYGYAALARAGTLIAEAICGDGGAGKVKEALKEFATLPLSSEWNGYAEAAGQTVIAAAIFQESAEKRDSMLEQGLYMLLRAQSGGFLLSTFSMGQVKPLAEGGGRLKDIAETMIRVNALLMPETRLMPKPPAAGPKRLPGVKHFKGTV
jgi:hypothetical protein